MPENLPERTYKHQVPADVFVEAFTTVAWTPEQTKKFNDLGILKCSFSDIQRRTDSFKVRFIGKEYENNNDFILVESIEVTSAILITGGYPIYNSINWIFKDCKLSNFDLRDFNYSYRTKLSDEKVKVSKVYLSFFECELENITLSYSYIGDLHVSKSTVGSIWISDSQIINFNLVTKSTIEILTFKNSKAEEIKIENSKTDKINIDTNSIIEGFFILDKSKTNDIRIWRDSSIHNVDVANCTLGFFEVNESDCTSISFTNVKSSLFLKKSIVSKVVIASSTLAVLEINDKNLKELFIRDGLIYILIFLKYTLKKETVVSFSNISVHSCIMDEFNVLGILYLRSIKRVIEGFDENFLVQNIPNVDIKNGTPETLQGFKQHLLINEPTLRIFQSSLGKTEFTECDLAGFNFEFNNSKITEVFISGGTVPDDVTVCDEINPVKILEQQKSFFDQLKKVFEGQGDIVRGTKYHARTSEIQMQIIEAGKRRWWFKYFDTEWWVYKLNETSNRHGESWGWAIVFTLVLSLIGFIFYNAALEPRKYDFVLGWNTDFLGDWAQFILPTHKTDFMVKEPNSNALFIDVVSRIFIGYGIYQLISAFRKHGKRG
jgi:hypothetical protein